MMYRLIFILLLSVSQLANSAPFETCPTKAFLFQGNPTTVYGVNLVTGTDSILQSDVGNVSGESSAGNVNGVGFDDFIAEDDTSFRYLFGFNTTHQKFVRLDSDFQQTELSVTNQPSGTFYVGDVYDHHYYFYRKGKGFYKMNLDQDAVDYLEIQTISTTATRNFTDFAFHPRTGKLYGVDNNSGVLYVVDKDTGSTQGLGTTGEKGTFGAGYFDVNGYFYVSRNQDGKIYRIDLSTIDLVGDTPPYPAVEFAAGPLSAQNDGARCANAPLIDESEEASTIDFGDAPDSYSTTLATNGARHEIVSGGPYLGSLAPDGEVDARLGILSDDANNDTSNIDDEDGIGFVTGLARGLDNVVVVNASSSGYLHAWFDWNRDGDFEDTDEHVFSDKVLSAGSNNLMVRVPIDADFGSSWARFRFGSQTGIGFSGGATDGEVEDHVIEISDLGVSYQYYPANGSFVTLAYEDLWPIEGDYDMNDVVFHYRSVTVIREGKLQRVDIYGQLLAIGASYHNGFAIRIPGVQANAVDTSKMRFRYSELDANGQGSAIEQGNPIESSDELIAIIAPDVWDLVTTSCEFYRTNENCTDDIQFAFELSLPFTELQDAANMSSLYDPFIFATENHYHGSSFATQPGRELEVHLVDIAPTEQANTSFFNMADDTSNIESSRYYKNANNLPWSMEVATEWSHPRSGIDLLKAYPNFEGYVTSNKVDNNDWYLEENRNEDKIYP
jgi:LruC domain-containing protein